MKQGCRDLFDYARQHLTPKDVAAFCLSDPGYPDYVREFQRILLSGTPPTRSNFEITETVCAARWTQIQSEAVSNRLRRFRTFTNSVGVLISVGDQGPGDLMPPNYFAISLLDDACGLEDEVLLKLLSPAFGELHQSVADSDWVCPEEGPFFLLGQLILASRGFHPRDDIPRLAEQLIAEATQYEGRASSEFLWGCTFFGQFHHRWIHYAKLALSVETDNPSLASLRNSLLTSYCP